MRQIVHVVGPDNHSTIARHDQSERAWKRHKNANSDSKTFRKTSRDTCCARCNVDNVLRTVWLFIHSWILHAVKFNLSGASTTCTTYLCSTIRHQHPMHNLSNAQTEKAQDNSDHFFRRCHSSSHCSPESFVTYTIFINAGTGDN